MINQSHNDSFSKLSLSTFTLSSCVAQNINKQSFTLSEIKKDLEILTNNLKELKEKENIMRISINILDADEWSEKLNELHIIKKSVEDHVRKYKNFNLSKKMKRIVIKQRCKRIRLKNKRKNTILQKKTILENRKKLHKQIDEWIRKENENDLKLKQSKDAAKHAEIVLFGVTKKKTDAKHYLQLLNSLKELRQVRKIAEQKDNSGEKGFEKKIDNLIAVWDDALEEYENEENSLRAILDNSYKSVDDQWKDVLFGQQLESTKISNQSFDKFLNIRRTWDSYIVPDESEYGSFIPNGWVAPNENSSEEWSQYAHF